MRKVMYENDEIKIDNGLFFGKGVFETILVNKKPVFLEEHVKIPLSVSLGRSLNSSFRSAE